MKPTLQPQVLVAGLLLAAGMASAADPGRLKVLYLGEPGTERATHVAGFLAKNVGKVETVSRHGFQSTAAEGFDVVVLDWPQSELARDERSEGNSPLGRRGEWTKPTVLLGSAGLNLAVSWKVRGGSG